MPTLAERRAQMASAGNSSSSGDFIKFSKERETRILRFLFTDATTIESHRKFWNEEENKWEIDGDRGSYRIVFNCVEYDKGGANPRRVRWELSEYLYNEYLSPYVERELPASQNVWEIQVRRPGTLEISYVAYKVEGATEVDYPIPEAASNEGVSAAGAKAPDYVAPKQESPIEKSTTVVSSAPVESTTTTEQPKKSKYF